MENKIGKTLHIIGIITIFVGIIGSLILSINLDSDFPVILFIGSIISFISGMVFIGFGEIISLLQENNNKKQEIIDIIKHQSNNNINNNSHNNMLNDIESNLPEI